MTLLRRPLLGAAVAAVLLAFAVLRADRDAEAPPTRPVVSSFWSIPVTGGRPTLLFSDRGQDHFTTYRRGGGSILFARASFASTSLFSVTPGNPPRRLRRLPVLTQFAYSPATDEIVVERGSEIVAESLSSGRSRVLAQARREPNGAVWSADGTTLVFGRQVKIGTDRYQPELVIVRAGRKKVFRLPASSPGPLALAPHGDRLSFRWGRQLFLLDTHTGRRRLFANRDSYAAAWSPDGRTIAYFDDGLVTRNLITNRRRLLVSKPVSISGVSFSPDGRTLVYTTLKLN
jgi:dipeptidyl aminopeptidase/acylaminoacyl peptidase